jgi:hypothetical protein
MPKKSCPCFNTKGTPARFRRLSIEQLLVINEQRRTAGLRELPFGTSVRRTCYMKVYRNALPTTQEENNSSRSENDGPAQVRPPQPAAPDPAILPACVHR